MQAQSSTDRLSSANGSNIATPSHDGKLDEEGGLEHGDTEQNHRGGLGNPLTLLRTKSSIREGPPPDGGLKAWTQALMCHLVVFNTWGSISSFGVFQAYYVTALDRPPSDISWIGSVQILLLFLVGTFSGRAMDAGYYRAVLVIGSLFVAAGVFMTSFCTQYWQLFLAQGICQGFGNGLLFCPTIALLSTYFLRKRALAISLAACGGATGGMVIPAIVQQLLPKIGFAWTVRVIGFVILFNFAIIIAFARTRISPRTTGPLIEWTAFKEPPYALFTTGSFLIFWGLYVAYFYVCCSAACSPCRRAYEV